MNAILSMMDIAAHKGERVIWTRPVLLVWAGPPVRRPQPLPAVWQVGLPLGRSMMRPPRRSRARVGVPSSLRCPWSCWRPQPW